MDHFDDDGMDHFDNKIDNKFENNAQILQAN